MGYIQTIVSFVVTCIFILIVLGFNETVYSVVDMSESILSEKYQGCRYNMSSDSVYLDSFTESDEFAREFLYGSFSVRGSCISSIVLAIGVFVMAIISKDLDFDMEAGKYRNSSCFHEGDTIAFISGILFRLLVAGGLFSSSISFACSLLALSKQNYVPVQLSESVSQQFGECVDSQLYRNFTLKLLIFFSSMMTISFMFLPYAVHYDKKASEENYNKI